MLNGITKLTHKEIQVPVNIADDPLTAMVRGAGIVLEDLDNLKEIILPSARD